MNQIVSKATIEEIAALRDKCVIAYENARLARAEADRLDKLASEALKLCAPHSLSFYLDEDEKKSANRQTSYVDCRTWDSFIRTSDLETLMDATAKKEFRAMLVTDTPEFTVDAAYDFIETFAAQSGMVFRRGIAEMFSKLDRRFRTHTGWKIGNRVILSRAFDDTGRWNSSYRHEQQSTLIDIERTFLILDGKKPNYAYAGIVSAVENAVQNIRYGHPEQFEVEGDYFKLRVFKNGNMHIWFTRDDLVTMANRLIGEYYGEQVPEERKYSKETEDEYILNTPKNTPAKNFGFFPTPDTLADFVIDRANIRKGSTVLEPSAGTGQLARRAVKLGAFVTCIEMQSHLAQGLKNDGSYDHVLQADFLEVSPTEKFDYIIMNPPFDRERDIDHVMHALKFLNDDGVLVAIMSQHTEFAESRKATAFREHIKKLNGRFQDNPRNSFSSVGTNVNTITLKVRANGKDPY